MDYSDRSPPPTPEPSEEFVSSRARRRRAQRRAFFPSDEEGRASLFTHLARRAYPSYELFVFSLVSGAIIGLGYFLDFRSVADLWHFGGTVDDSLDRHLACHDCRATALLPANPGRGLHQLLDHFSVWLAGRICIPGCTTAWYSMRRLFIAACGGRISLSSRSVRSS